MSFNLLPQSDILNSGLLNEVNSSENLWKSVVSGDDNKFLQGNLQVFGEFGTLFTDSRSSVDNIKATLFLDTNLTPYTVDVNIIDDQNLIVASGEKVTVSKSEMISTVNNIQIEYDKIIDNLVDYNNRVLDIISQLSVFSYCSFDKF